MESRTRARARVSSICAVCEGDLDEIRGLRIPDTKTGPRWFPVPVEIASSLKEHFAENEGPLIAGSPKVAPQIVRDRLRRACKAAGVKPFPPHGFRRMVVDRMIRGGVDPATAASLTGHSVEVMLRSYRKVTDEDRRQASQQNSGVRLVGSRALGYVEWATPDPIPRSLRRRGSADARSGGIRASGSAPVASGRFDPPRGIAGR